MEGDLIFTAILFLVTGLPFLLAGYLIAVKKKLSLIAGFDENSATNPERYAAVFGGCAIACGVALGIAAYFFSAHSLSALEFTASIVLASLVQIITATFCKIMYG